MCYGAGDVVLVVEDGDRMRLVEECVASASARKEKKRRNTKTHKQSTTQREEARRTVPFCDRFQWTTSPHS